MTSIKRGCELRAGDRDAGDRTEIVGFQYIESGFASRPSPDWALYLERVTCSPAFGFLINQVRRVRIGPASEADVARAGGLAQSS